MDWEQRRELFSLDWGVGHLNHGSFGAVPLPAQRAQQRLRDEMEANPIAFFTRGLIERIEHSRTHLARFVGAEPDGVALVANATAAASAVLRSLSLAEGQEILVTDHAYGAVRLAAEDLAGRAGAIVRTVAVPLLADDDEIVTRVVQAVRPGRTRLAVIDHVASATAKLFPVDRLTAQLKDRGVAVLVDAAHAPGMLAVDVAASGADFWFGNLHKWAFAPRATALLSVALEHRQTMRPLVVSWEHLRGFPQAQEWAGTLDYTAWLAAPTGLHLLRTLGLDRVRTYNAALVAQGQRLVAETIRGLAPSTDVLDAAATGELGSGEVSMRVVALPSGIASDLAGAIELRARLAREHQIEVGVSAWNGIGLLRLSAQVYNRVDDYERLSRALRRMLSR